MPQLSKRSSNKKELSTIFLIVFMDLFGFGIILPLLPYIAETFSANAATIGLLTAVYSLFQFIAGPVLGKLSDRYGRKKLLVISQFGSMVGYIVLGVASSLPLLFLSRIIDGITGGNISIAQAYIADITTTKSRAKGMGLIGAAFGLGFMLGPAIGGYLSVFGFAVPAFFAAGVAAITTAATALFLPETTPAKNILTRLLPRPSTSFPKILRTRPFGILVFSLFFLSLGFSGIQGTYALFVQTQFGWGPKEVGSIFGLIGTVAIITQLKILPFFVARFGEKKTLVSSIPLLASGFGLLAVARTIPLVVTANILIPLGNSLANPTISALASEHVSANKYGHTLGILASAGSLGRILGPILGDLLYYRFSPATPYFTSAVIFLGVFFFLTSSLRSPLSSHLKMLI